MADWFAKLMHRGRARGRPIAGAGLWKYAGARRKPDTRDPRYDAIVQMLRDREAEDREAREKRQRGYRQSVDWQAPGPPTFDLSPPSRLYKFRTKVPCRATPEARALLDQLNKLYSGSTITFQLASGQQAVMLTRRAGAQPRQIGRVEQCVEGDPQLCNVRNQGLSVERDGEMLVLRFRYPSTAARMSREHDAQSDEIPRVHFTEVRPALDLRPSDKSSSPPRLVWVTRPELETMNALCSRDYEAFYVRFKLEVQAGIWSSLSASLASSPGSRWHGGSYYTVVREPDATNRRIHERTVDDSGRVVDIGADRMYDAAAATDILLLYLDGDILADVADVYFTLQSLSSADAYSLKEELFTIIRRFWASSRSLASRYGSDLAAVVRMTQRALPMPAQVPLLKQDWTNLRQSLLDRYGEAGRKAADLAGEEVHRPRMGPIGWPFASFAAGEVNVGLRLVYRQEWRLAGAQQGETTGDLDAVVEEAVKATVGATKWPLDFDGRIDTGARPLAATTDMGLETECRESSHDTSTRLSDIMRRMASNIADEPALALSAEVTTRPAEIQNVVLVAEKLPAPAEIDLAWVRRYESPLAKVLLDESVRDALDTIRREARSLELDAKRDRLYAHLRANILHYQRAIWQQEDPQQRSMRYRKSGKKVPLEWRFELQSGGAMTIDELRDRLSAANVDGQFAAYSSGREADLDQVIDPAGPIGYYGNYAIYHMRPELGSEELFSMLHFFKSPFLRPNPETGEPEVADPMEARISDDPAVAASDEAIDEHRDEIFQNAPHLQLALAQPPQEVFANGHPDAQSDWAVQAPSSGLVLPGSWFLVPGSKFLVPCASVARSNTAVAGGEAPRAPHADVRVIVARRDVGLRLNPGGDPHHSTLPALDSPLCVRAGAGNPAAECVILRCHDRSQEPGTRNLELGSYRAAAHVHERVILARGDEWLRPSLVASYSGE